MSSVLWHTKMKLLPEESLNLEKRTPVSKSNGKARILDQTVWDLNP